MQTQRYLPYLLGAALGVSACGGDDKPVYFGPNAVTIPIEGTYKVHLAPLGSNCFEYQALPSTEYFQVHQSGPTIFIETQGGGDSSYELSIDVAPMQGPLYNNGSFSAAANGGYYNPFSGFSGPLEMYTDGFFEPGGIQGVRDVAVYDPFYGAPCMVSHAYNGSRL